MNKEGLAGGRSGRTLQVLLRRSDTILMVSCRDMAQFQLSGCKRDEGLGGTEGCSLSLFSGEKGGPGVVAVDMERKQTSET